MSIYEYDDKKRKRHRKPITSDMWINIYIYIIILIPILDILFSILDILFSLGIIWIN